MSDNRVREANHEINVVHLDWIIAVSAAGKMVKGQK